MTDADPQSSSVLARFGDRVIHWWIGCFAIVRRELLSLFVTPLAYLVSALFLLQQGWNFSLLLRFLNDPLAASGPVMQFYFGGSFFIFWLPVMFTCAVLSMRLIAEERSRGTLEALLTAALQPSQIVLGKFVGVYVYYVLLWVPTGTFYILLRSVTRWSDASAPELGPIAAGYLGAGLVGACFLALGLLASALVRSQMGAAITSFVASSILLLSGLLVGHVSSGAWATVLEWTNLLAMMQEMSQGIVDGHWLWLTAMLVASCLAAAMWAIDPRRDRQSSIQLACFVITVACLGIAAGRHAGRGDWTRGEVFSLSESARTLLSSLQRDVDVVVILPETIGGGRTNPVRAELREVLTRMARHTPRLRIRMIDPDRQRQEAERWVANFGSSGRELADGVVLIRSGQGPQLRRQHLLPTDLVVFETGVDVQANGPRVKAFRGEAQLVNAFLNVTAERNRSACYTRGHGEPAFDGLEPYGGYAKLRDLLQSTNLETVEVALAPTVGPIERPFASCDILIIAGPTQPFASTRSEAVQDYLKGGGNLLMLAGAVIHRDAAVPSDHGLENELARYGIIFGERIVLDPHRMPATTALLAFSRADGWHDHPISRSLFDKMVSFQFVRELELRAPAVPVFSVGEDAWAEAELATLTGRGEQAPKFDPSTDRRGPIPVVAASEVGSSRVVVIASDQFALNARLREDVVYDHGRELITESVRWLIERDGMLGMPARRREHVKLLLAPGQLERMIWLCTLGMPGFSVLLGFFMLWRRRR